MLRPRRTPNNSPLDNHSPLSVVVGGAAAAGTDSQILASSSSSFLPETVQQIARSSSVSAADGGGGNAGPQQRRRKRQAQGGSMVWNHWNCCSCCWSLWLRRPWRDTLYEAPHLRGGWSARHHHRARGWFWLSSSKSAMRRSAVLMSLLALVVSMGLLLGSFLLVSLESTSSFFKTGKRSSGSGPRFLSGSVSELASQPFRVTFAAAVAAERAFLHLPPPLTAWDRQIVSKQKDFGGLEIRFFEEVGMRQQQRVIYHDFQNEWGVDKLKNGPNDDDANDYYYAFDDDNKRNPLVGWNDPDIQDEKECRRTSWHRELPINCNSVHEFDFETRFRSGDTKYLGEGAYREVFLSRLQEGDFVFKEYIWDTDYGMDNFEFMRMDAIVAEKLSWSSRIVDIYAFCALGMINEAMQNGDMEHIAVPSEIGRSTSFEALENSVELKVQNSLTGSQKLRYAWEMAEAVLLLHAYPDGVIVHDDIQLSQFLLAKDGTLKLNDFNRAEIMLYNEKDNEYCRYRNNPGHGDWRAPEEYYDKPLNEQIDIWSLGNNFYTLLTGFYPFPDSEEDRVRRVVKRGEQAFIDPRFAERSLGEKLLAQVIPRCWVYEPNVRITIFELVEYLRHAVDLDRQQKSA